MRKNILGKLSHKATQLHNILKPTAAWDIEPSALSTYPENSLGFELYLFYEKNKFHLIAGMEYHDADHIILELNTDVKSEVILQFFLWGNGKRTFFSTLACLSAIMILPEMWFNCLLAIKKGKSFKPMWHVNLKNELNNTIDQVRSKVLSPIKIDSESEQNFPIRMFYHRIF